MQIYNCDQNSPDWFEARRGIPTASGFSAILAKGEGRSRASYMKKLANEIVTGEQTKSFENEHTIRGHIMEADARELYIAETGFELTQVGFISNGRAGCSPDSLIGDDGGVEIKSKLPKILQNIIRKDKSPPEHTAQVQGTLWITEREWWDMCIYWPDMPLFVKRVYRDEHYITRLAEAVDKFNEELHQLVRVTT